MYISNKKDTMPPIVVVWFFVLFGVIGWGLNVWKFVANFDLEGNITMTILHGIGIILAPLGVILGWFVW